MGSVSVFRNFFFLLSCIRGYRHLDLDMVSRVLAFTLHGSFVTNW